MHVRHLIIIYLFVLWGEGTMPHFSSPMKRTASSSTGIDVKGLCDALSEFVLSILVGGNCNNSSNNNNHKRSYYESSEETPLLCHEVSLESLKHPSPSLFWTSKTRLEWILLSPLPSQRTLKGMHLMIPWLISSETSKGFPSLPQVPPRTACLRWKALPPPPPPPPFPEEEKEEEAVLFCVPLSHLVTEVEEEATTRFGHRCHRCHCHSWHHRTTHPLVQKQGGGVALPSYCEDNCGIKYCAFLLLCQSFPSLRKWGSDVCDIQ